MAGITQRSRRARTPECAHYSSRVPTVLRALLLAVLLTAAPVTVGVIVASPQEAEPVPPYTGTPLDEYDTSTVALARSGFCDRLSEDAVHAALAVDDSGAEADAATEVVSDSYNNGEQSAVTGRQDVMHEYGCTFRAGKAAAAAWIFAPPVTEQQARRLIRTSSARGCRVVRDAPDFGSPSVALSCGDRPTVSFRGLFGDAWLTCEVRSASTGDPDDQVDRAGRWCVAVARAATR